MKDRETEQTLMSSLIRDLGHCYDSLMPKFMLHLSKMYTQRDINDLERIAFKEAMDKLDSAFMDAEKKYKELTKED